MAALNLADLASHVYVVTKREHLKVAERIIETRLKKAENIEIIPNSSVKKIIGENKVEGVEIEILGEPKTLEVDGIFVEVGKKPQTTFLSDMGVELRKGYIVADGNQMSSVPGLFAAGDVVFDSVKQVGVAIAQGTVATLSAYDYIKNNF
jgi:thioredoxin reductase